MNPADSPILFASDDLLDRAAFARSLARKIDRMSDLESGFVIGLDGEWGSGKTSVINMTIQALRHEEMHAASSSEHFHGDVAEIMSLEELDELAPLFSKVAPAFQDTTVDLTYVSPDHFNRCMARRLVQPPSDAAALYRYFRLHLSYRKNPANLVVTFSPWLIPKAASLAAAFISDLARAVGEVLGEEVGSAFKSYAARISELAPIAGTVADLGTPGAGNLFRVGGNWLKSYADRTRSLDDLKGSLERQLKAIAPTKIVVVIDDLDRLTPKEAAQMISLVKGLGRLPNVIYLLGYHLEVLTQHLDKVHNGQNGEGTIFLEKIVQYQRRLPMLAHDSLIKLLDPLIDGSLRHADDNVRKRFGEAWRNFAIHRVKTPRDIVRIGNAFKIAHSDLGDHTDPADLFILEVIAAKDAGLYNWIRSNIQTLCGGSFEFAGPDGRKKLREFIEKAGYQKDTSAVRGLALLFPTVAEAFQTFGSSGDDRLSRIQKRIHLAECAPSYFDIAPPRGSWEKSFLEETLSSENPDEAIANILAKAVASGEFQSALRAQFLEVLVSEFGDGHPIPLPWLNALVKHSRTITEFKDAKDTFWNRRDNYQRMANAVFRGLDATEETARPDLILHAMEEAQDFSLLAHVLRSAIGNPKSDQSSRQRLSFAGSEDAVRDAMIDKIKELAKADAIWQQAKPADLIWFWHQGSPGKDAYEYLNRQAHRPEMFVHLVDLLVSTVSSSTEGDYEQVAQSQNEVIDLNLLKSKAEEYASNPENPSHDQANRFLKAYERGVRDPFPTDA